MSKRIKVLVVDDSAVVRQTLSEILASALTSTTFCNAKQCGIEELGKVTECN